MILASNADKKERERICVSNGEQRNDFYFIAKVIETRYDKDDSSSLGCF